MRISFNGFVAGIAGTSLSFLSCFRGGKLGLHKLDQVGEGSRVGRCEGLAATEGRNRSTLQEMKRGE